MKSFGNVKDQIPAFPGGQPIDKGPYMTDPVRPVAQPPEYRLNGLDGVALSNSAVSSYPYPSARYPLEDRR
jgi:hypothetical protein